LTLSFAFRFGEVSGTVAISSDSEKSEGNEFQAGEWGEEEADDKFYLMISEVYYNPSDGDNFEFIKLYNPTSDDIDLFKEAYKLGDEEKEGDGEGMYEFPSGAIIKATNYLIIARKAAAFKDAFEISPDFEWVESDTAVPNMKKYTSWAGGYMDLANSGDEVLLLDKENKTIDVVTYGSGSYSGVISHTNPSGPGNSLLRIPKDEDTNDCSVDFFAGNPTPGI